MALPKPARPEYSTTIPSTGKKIKYNPFSVREEKILILASESNDMDEIANAVSNVLTNCVTSPGFKVDELALFDIEYLFLKTRAKSVGEKLEVNVTDPGDSTYTTRHEIDVDKIKVDIPKEHNRTLDLGDEISVVMNYPGLEFFVEGIKMSELTDRVDLAAQCVSQIVMGDEVYAREDMSTPEVIEWMEALSSAQFNKLMEFFMSMPRLRHSFKLKNPNSGEFFSITLEGLQDFF